MALLAPTLLMVVLASTPPANDAADPDADLRKAVEMLVQEAARSWRESNDWPRTRPDFAQSTDIKLTNEQVLRAMAARIHENTMLDAYAKWQLLSYNPDVSQASLAGIELLINAMPGLLRTPEPSVAAAMAGGGDASGRQAITRAVGVNMGTDMTDGARQALGDRASQVNQGPSFGVGSSPPVAPGDRSAVAAGVQRQNQVVAEARQIVNRANMPANQYRQALMARLPSARGIRLAAMLRDVAARVDAADPAAEAAARRMVDLAQEQHKDDSIARDMRDRLRDEAKRIHAKPVVLVRELGIDNRGRVVPVTETIALSTDDLKLFMGAMQGYRLRRK